MDTWYMSSVIRRFSQLEKDAEYVLQTRVGAALDIFMAQLSGPVGTWRTC